MAPDGCLEMLGAPVSVLDLDHARRGSAGLTLGSGVSEKNSSPERREERKRRGKSQERQGELLIDSGLFVCSLVLCSWVVHRRAPAQHEAGTSVLGWYNRDNVY